MRHRPGPHIRVRAFAGARQCRAKAPAHPRSDAGLFRACHSGSRTRLAIPTSSVAEPGTRLRASVDPRVLRPDVPAVFGRIADVTAIFR